MANETFTDVVNQLKKNQDQNTDGLQAVSKTVATLNQRMQKFFNELAAQRLDDLEEKREQRTSTTKAAGGLGATSEDKKGLSFLPLLFSKTGLIGSLLAVGGALAGLRGWEAGALKAIGKIKTGLTDNLTKKFISLRAQILTGIGLDATLKKFNDPKSGLKTPITTQIIDKFKGLRTNILKVFGLGADGKPIAVRGADGLFKVPVISRVTSAIGTLLSPLKFITDGISTFFKTTGKGIMSFLKTIGIIGGSGAIAVGAGVGGVLKVLGRVLWPIGILTSIFEGFQSYQGSDAETKIGKFADGIAGAIGSFLGAPLDLLKSLILGGFKMVGIGVKMNDKGELVETDFMEMLQKFKIQDAIAAIPKAIRGIFKFVGDFIADPIGIGGPILKSITINIRDFFINTLKSIVSFFGMGALAPDFLKSDSEKRLAQMEDERDRLRDEKNFADRKLKGFQRANKGSFTNIEKRSGKLRLLAENASEISRIEAMIESGQFETGYGFGKIRNLTQAEAKLEKLNRDRENQIEIFKKLRLASIQVKTLPNEISALNAQIEELATAIKENPAKAANIVSGNKFEGGTNISNSGATFSLSNNDSTDADAYRLRYGRQ